MKIPVLFLSLASILHAAPILTSWHTADSGRYARIWATSARETTERGGGGQTSLTTWDSADYAGVTVSDQPLPVYAGIQGISYSDTYVYIKATGLATDTMGPRFLNAARTAQFPSFPGNAAILFRFPRATNYPSTYTNTARTATNVGTSSVAPSDVVSATDTLATKKFYRLRQTGISTYDTTTFSTATGTGGPPGGDPR